MKPDITFTYSKTRNAQPDICTSLRCNNYGCDYCKQCSHAIFKHTTMVKGMLVSWEFNPRTGPVFKPGTNHAIYDAFEKWRVEKGL